MNGQQYSRSEVPFVYHAPEAVASLSPASGATAGETPVRALGTGVQPFKERLCRFGERDRTVAARWTSSGEYRCVSPSASAANATTRRALDFGAPLAGVAALYSRTPSDAAVRDGVLVLTEAQPLHERSMVIELPALWEEQRYFEASFDLYAGGGNGGEGASVCLGVLPEVPFGEEGAGVGLRVLLRTRAENLEVHLGDVLLLRRALPSSLVRAGRFVRVLLAHGPPGLSVQLGGEWLVQELALSPWAPLSTWRFGIGARTGVEAYDEHSVDNVLLVAGSEHAARPVAVEVASNGQQFSTSGVRFMHNAPPVVSAFYPERGPQTGSTVVRILGANFGAGVHFMCRFDGVAVDASYDEANSTMHCASVPRATARAAPLEVSLNSQQYTTPAVSFTWYAPPTVRLVTPDAGPVGGNTTVRLFGEGLDAGLDYYRCRFGGSVVPASVGIERWGQPTLLCVSPEHLAGSVALEVALNSQQYTASGRRYVFYEPPAVVDLAPAAGVFYGKSGFSVRGEHLRADMPDAQCRFGRSWVNAAYHTTPLELFGDSLVPARPVANGAFQCIAPTAAQAGVARRLRLAWSSAQLAGSVLVGGSVSAVLLGSAAVWRAPVPWEHEPGWSSLLTLTQAAMGQTGSVVLTAMDDLRPMREFRASFRASILGNECGEAGVAGRCGAEGVSFVFGPLSNTPFGELGVGVGLRVSLLSGLRQRIEVRFNELLLACVPADLHARGGWAPMEVTHDSEGLRVVHDGQLRVHNLTLPGWAPQTDWKFGFGARTGAATDEHMIGDVLIEAGALVEDVAAPLEVTLNGQQFSNTSVDYSFSAPARVSTFSPTSGPVAGATDVTVYGSHFGAGYAYRCTFGSGVDNATGIGVMTVPATLINSAALACRSPGNSAGERDLAVSVDAQNFTFGGAPFTYYEQTGVTLLAPTGGPASAGRAVITVRGPSFAGGSDYRCKFGALAVRATPNGIKTMAEWRVRLAVGQKDEQDQTTFMDLLDGNGRGHRWGMSPRQRSDHRSFASTWCASLKGNRLKGFAVRSSTTVAGSRRIFDVCLPNVTRHERLG